MLEPAKKLRGEINVPGDKSISHRSVMFGSIAKGITEVNGFLDSADCRSTISCFRKMGVKIEQKSERVIIQGKGMRGLNPPVDDLDVGNSGTTMRLISGILAGQRFISTLTGDESIKKRPMERIITPLSMMGADIKSEPNGLAPLIISGGSLCGIDYTLPVASAQVKSCIILAGLYADDKTRVTEIAVSRDHTERMLKAFGADIYSEYKTINVLPAYELRGTSVSVPGDISSAAYFIAAGLIHPDADILIKNVNINPTRAGIIEIVKKMGGKIEILDEHTAGGEEVANIHVQSSSLKGVEVSGEIIPTLIDELPVIALLAAFADGKTVIMDAAELKKKESDRIVSVTDALKSMGADVTPTDDGMVICGGKSLHGADIKTYDDHRIAMTFATASLLIDDMKLDNPDCVNISFGNFYKVMDEIRQ